MLFRSTQEIKKKTIKNRKMYRDQRCSKASRGF